MNQNNKLPILLPNEIIDIIISYRNIHPLSMIIKNEYINIFNKKYKNYLKKMFNDLTNGINRANHFFYRGEEDINIQDDDERSINNDDNISILTDIFETNNNQYYDDYDYENTEEQWAFTNTNETIQFQAINCKNCGEYKLSNNLFISNKIICTCL
jgi:hypothetical protein